MLVTSSTIIEDIKSMREAGLASLAYFYFDFMDTAKQDIRGLLASLLVQLSARSDHCCDILSAFYSRHDSGLQQPSIDALSQCLKDMLKNPRQGPTYIILDAVDECPRKTGTPSLRERVLGFLLELFKLNLPDLRICITSRPESGIEAILQPLSSHCVSLHDQIGQFRDVVKYIKAMVNLDQNIQQWSVGNKQLVIDTLSQKADGMYVVAIVLPCNTCLPASRRFRWVFCQLNTLRRCHPERIQRTLEELPGTLDGTYEQALESIEEENWEYAHRLFQCITVASRPLRVEELAEFLAFDFGNSRGVVPTFMEDWRPRDPRGAVVSTCSSLIAVVQVHGAQIVQFSHFSVREFLTSSRLFVARQSISRYFISLEPAHTIITQACLSVLLQPNGVNGRAIREFPLAKYASRYWICHAMFKNVSSCIRYALEAFFDPNKPYFMVWVSMWDIDEEWRTLRQWTTSNSKRTATALYYAALCGFHDVVEWLVKTRLQPVNAEAGNHGTPLHATSVRGHLEVARFLLEHGADINHANNTGQTSLHLAAAEGHSEMARLLLEHGANLNAQDMKLRTPMHYGIQGGHMATTRLLLQHSTGVPVKDEDGKTSLHFAAEEGHSEIATLLIEHGANVNAQDTEQRTPLHCGAQGGHSEMAMILLKHRANVHTQDTKQRTAMHYAAQGGHAEVIRLLLQHGAVVQARDEDGETPLHLASQEGHSDIARLLLEHSANVNTQDTRQQTPLHYVVQGGHMEMMHLLLIYGADLRARNKDGKTPLDLTTPTVTAAASHAATTTPPTTTTSSPATTTTTTTTRMPWQCLACLATFSRWQERDRHLVSHLPHWIHCPLPHCPWRGNRLHLFKRHWKSHPEHHESYGRIPRREQFEIFNRGEFLTRISAGAIPVHAAAFHAVQLVLQKADQLQKPSLSMNVWGYKLKQTPQ